MVENRSNLTPEKQLLKLIEDPHGRAQKPGAAKGVKVPVFSFGALQGRLAFFRQSTQSLWKGWAEGSPLDIKKINALLSVLVVATGIYFVASSAVLAMRLSGTPSFPLKAGSAAGQGGFKYAPQLKALPYYKEKVGSRDLFRLGAKEAAAAQTPVAQEDAAKKQQEAILSKYKLVGISWSDNPDAMIENTGEQKTYFVKRGQMLDGIKVAGIFRDKVVLNSNGQEIELR